MFSKIAMSIVSAAGLFAVGLTACGQPEVLEVAGPALAQSQQALAGTAIYSGLGSNLCLDVEHGSPVPRANVQLFACNGPPAQQWTLPSEGSQGEIRSALAENLCLDVAGGYPVPGVNVQIFTCNA